MRFSLIATDGPHAGQDRVRGPGRLVVGRASPDVCLSEDHACSSRHLEIEAGPSQFLVKDLGSKNGTLLNGRPLPTTEPVALRPGDVLSVGRSRLRFVRSPEEDLPDVPGFVLERRLARSLTGEVYLARWGHDNRPLAVKRLEHETKPLLHRLKREAQLLERFPHPHVERFHSAGVAGGRFVLATEHDAALDVVALVRRRGPRPVAEAVAIVRQVLAALAHLHANHVVHRNLRPSTVQLSGRPGNWHARVGDFGLARYVREEDSEQGVGGGPLVYGPEQLAWVDREDVTYAGARAGAPLFVSPEQAKDLHTVTAAGDQYAAVATLYYLLTGKAPYDPPAEGEEPFELVGGTDPVPIRARRPDLPIALASVVFQALQRSPEGRYRDVSSLDAALAPFAA